MSRRAARVPPGIYHQGGGLPAPQARAPSCSRALQPSQVAPHREQHVVSPPAEAGAHRVLEVGVVDLCHRVGEVRVPRLARCDDAVRVVGLRSGQDLGADPFLDPFEISDYASSDDEQICGVFALPPDASVEGGDRIETILRVDPDRASPLRWGLLCLRGADDTRKSRLILVRCCQDVDLLRVVAHEHAAERGAGPLRECPVKDTHLGLRQLRSLPGMSWPGRDREVHARMGWDEDAGGGGLSDNDPRRDGR